VGAILLFFGAVPSSFSLSLVSPCLLLPVWLFVVLRGVSGGVVIGTPVTLPELAAAIPGTLPTINDGFVITPVGAAEDTVAIEDVELDLVGEDGLALTKEAAGGGDGAVKELAESRWRC
jgi:hypothetical protein